MLCTKSPRLLERIQEAYKEKDRQVKKSAKRDKRAFVEDMADKAEQAAARGEMSTIYNITKKLSGKYTSQSAPVKDKDGNILRTEQEQTARWAQHFREVLNCPAPVDPANPQPSEHVLNIDTSPPTIEEVKLAIKAMKGGKAAGIDSIQSEMLKADLNTSSKVLTGLFRNIWERETIPHDWDKGLIIKIPKKGNHQNCDNWRGITLLSIPSKVFCRIMIGRIDSAVDQTLREEQAGFRRERGCTDQIFALKNIIEQCLEWNAPLYINFIDFRKAFDSLHRDTLWKIARSYGIPPKMVSLMGLFYRHFECSVLVNGIPSEWFTVESGVRQGCIMSPILFLMAIDWVMRKTTANRPRGIQWTLFSQLEDLDFADDLAVLSSTLTHLQEKTDILSKFAEQTGLNINTAKTQVMCFNATPSAPVTVNGHTLDYVEDFTYLGSLVSKENATQKDIKARLGKAHSVFVRLQSIWKSKQYSLRTKVRLYNSNVKSVLLYGSECWRVTVSDMKRIDAFHNRCLRKICRIFWPERISNEELHRVTKCNSVVLEIRRRRFNWLGHVFRMAPDRIPKVALGWTPAGKRKRGRPKTTWRRTVATELKEVNLTWGQALHAAQDRSRWRQIVKALCPTWDEED